MAAWAQPEVDRLAYVLAGHPVYFLGDGLRHDLQFFLKHVQTVEELDGFLQTHPQERARYLRIMHGLFDPATAWRCVPFAHRPGSPPAQAQNWGVPYE
jgi:hypothetical protein